MAHRHASDGHFWPQRDRWHDACGRPVGQDAFGIDRRGAGYQSLATRDMPFQMRVAFAEQAIMPRYTAPKDVELIPWRQNRGRPRAYDQQPPSRKPSSRREPHTAGTRP